MPAFFSGSMKPGNVLLATMPGGGTRPTRDPGGKTTSADFAASAGLAGSTDLAGSAGLAGSAHSAGSASVNNASAAASVPRAMLEAILPLVIRSISAVARLGWHFDARARDPAQCQIDPAALRKQGRCTRVDAVDAMEGKPIAAAEHQRVAGTEPERTGRIAALRTA